MNNSDDWKTLVRDGFDFALRASERFQTDDTDVKKTIAKTVGSNLTLLDQKIEFQPRFMFLQYRKGIKQTKKEIARLVPMNGLTQQTNLGFFVKNSIWYPIWDDVRTYLSSIDVIEKTVLTTTFSKFKKEDVK